MFIKILPYIAFVAAGFIAGLIFQSKVLNQKIEIPACPACNCPAAISLQNFEPNKIKGIKTFNYSPSISGNITVIVDSVKRVRTDCK